MADDNDHDKNNDGDPDDWADILGRAATETPAAVTRPPPQPETTGVRKKADGIDYAVEKHEAPPTDRPPFSLSLVRDEDHEGERTSTMKALQVEGLLERKKLMLNDGTLPPEGQPHNDSSPSGQGLPAGSTDPARDGRYTLPGTGLTQTIGTPLMCSKSSHERRTPARGVSGHPNYRGPVVAEEQSEKTPPEGHLTIRPARHEYEPTVKSFRAEARKDSLDPPEHQAPPSVDEHTGDEGAHIVTIPPCGKLPIDLWIKQGSQRLLLGVAILALILLTMGIYHLVNNWWYYNPF